MVKCLLLLGIRCVCQNRRRGLGLKQSQAWNIALVGKLVWWIVVQPDRLWVQWVHHVYLKGSTWLQYNPPTDCCWYWRKICSVKDTINGGFVEGQWSLNSGLYTVKCCYQWLREKKELVDWHKAVWCPVAAPKHNFIAWLVAHQALKLKDKLVLFGVCADDLCCICQLFPETHHHLFTHCQFSQDLLQLVGNWLGTDISANGFLLTIARRRWSNTRKKITTAALIACLYFIWLQRNEARINHCLTRPSIIAGQVQEVIRSRFQCCKPVCISQKDVHWLSKVHLV
ncbi:uncharacterized protein LOC141631931 [Silene latifolia]|uniref:uncharacterized protein LOC141631931 n=1 Tax=Silene latifolia TaxID=37657 RepID=UPI003D785D83